MAISHSVRRARKKFQKTVQKKRSLEPLKPRQFERLMVDFYEFAKTKGFYPTIQEALDNDGYHMFNFQRESVREILKSLFMQISMEINISISRRTGKTECVALAAAYSFNKFFQVFQQPVGIIVIAPEKGTASVPFKMIEKYIDKKLLIDGGDTKKRKESARGDNVELFGIYDEYKGSMIEGRDAHLIIRDEAHMGDDNKYQDQVAPTLVSNRGASVFLGNGGYRNCLFKKRIDRCHVEGGRIINKETRHEEVLIRYTYTELRPYFQELADQGIQACKTRIDNIDHEIKQAGGMKSREVRKNYFCKWMAEYGNCVTQEQLKRCHDTNVRFDPKSKEDLYLGLDFATVKDRTVATIMNGKKEIIDWIIVKDINDTRQPRDQLTHLRRVCEDKGYYDHLIAIGFDATGVGLGGVYQFLEDEFMCDLLPYKFSEITKNDWYPKAIESIVTLYDVDRIKFNPEHPYAEIFEKEWIDLERREYETKKGAKYSAPARENHFDDFCFVAGTKVATQFGQKNIEDIKIGDFVWTPFGLRKVFNSGCTGRKKVVTNVGLTGTPGHPVYVNGKGFKSLTMVNQATTINLTFKNLIKWKFLKLLNLMGQSIDSWEPEDIIFHKLKTTKTGRGPKGFIRQFGNITTKKKFLRATVFITKMVIALITTSLTWSLSIAVNMLGCILKKEWKIPNIGKKFSTISVAQRICENLRKLAELLNIGKREVKFRRNYGKMLHVIDPAFAFSAIQNSWHSTGIKNIVQIPANKSGGDEIDVYNLTVDGGTYFANNILVHNCASFAIVNDLSAKLNETYKNLSTSRYKPQDIKPEGQFDFLFVQKG